MGHVPIYDDSAPIVCTITDQEVPDRLALLERMRTNLTAIEPSEHGLVLHFPIRDDVEADIRRFAADEKRCCEFWGFDVTKAPEELTLRWDGPPGSRDLLERIEAYFTGHLAISALSGLL